MTSDASRASKSLIVTTFQIEINEKPIHQGPYRKLAKVGSVKVKFHEPGKEQGFSKNQDAGK
jgi:hypothetical protein